MPRKLSDQVQELIKRPSNVVQSLSRMLQRDCRSSEVFVEDKFLPFYLYLTPFPAEGDFRSEKAEELFTNMKRFVQEKRIELATHRTVSLNILKLQYFYHTSSFDMESIMQKNSSEIRHRSRKIMKQVLKISPKSIEACDRLLRKITALVAIDNELGEANVETEAAVKSILSAKDLFAFTNLNNRDKLEVLDDLKVIVCGIRLFNNDAGHETDKIIDLTLLLEKSFDNTRLVLEYEQEKSDDNVQDVTEKILSSGLLASIPQPALDANHANYLKEISLFVHQSHQIISTILSKLMGQNVEMFETVNGYRKTLKDMHAILVYKTAINTRDIYPKFKYLGFAWKKMQQYVYFISEINLFLDKLHSLDSVCDYLKDIKMTAQVENREERKSSKSLKSKTHSDPSTPPTCEYLDCCAWSLSLGFILPVGDDKRNVLEINSRRYLFHSPQALRSFESESEKSLLDIVKVLYERPELMIFLERTEEVGHIARIQDQEYRKTFYGSKDMTCQTELASDVSTKINAVQEIILLRRKGFRLANQVLYRSSTSQTETGFNGKYNMSTQTKGVQSRCVQTASDKEIQTE